MCFRAVTTSISEGTGENSNDVDLGSKTRVYHRPQRHMCKRFKAAKQQPPITFEEPKSKIVTAGAWFGTARASTTSRGVKTCAAASTAPLLGELRNFETDTTTAARTAESDRPAELGTQVP